MQKPQLARCPRASKPDSLPIEFPAAPGASGAAEGKIQQRGFSCCVCTCFHSPLPLLRPCSVSLIIHIIIGAQKATSSGRSRRSLRVRPRRGQNGAPFPFRRIQRPGTCFIGFSARAHRSHRFRDTRRGPCWPRCARPSHPGRPPAGGRRSLPQWATRYRNAQPPAG